MGGGRLGEVMMRCRRHAHKHTATHTNTRQRTLPPSNPFCALLCAPASFDATYGFPLWLARLLCALLCALLSCRCCCVFSSQPHAALVLHGRAHRLLLHLLLDAEGLEVWDCHVAVCACHAALSQPRLGSPCLMAGALSTQQRERPTQIGGGGERKRKMGE